MPSRLQFDLKTFCTGIALMICFVIAFVPTYIMYANSQGWNSADRPIIGQWLQTATCTDGYSLRTCFTGYVNFTNENNNKQVCIWSLQSGDQQAVQSYMQLNYPVGSLKTVYWRYDDFTDCRSTCSDCNQSLVPVVIIGVLFGIFGLSGCCLSFGGFILFIEDKIQQLEQRLDGNGPIVISNHLIQPSNKNGQLEEQVQIDESAQSVEIEGQELGETVEAPGGIQVEGN